MTRWKVKRPGGLNTREVQCKETVIGKNKEGRGEGKKPGQGGPGSK